MKRERKEKQKKIKRQLVTVNQKTKGHQRGVKNKIEMVIQRTLQNLQCNKINHYTHLIKSIINN